jgi:cytidine deaminase
MTVERTPEALVAAARKVAQGAYAPYSKFHVGSIVVAEDGTEYAGVNVENAAYGSTICAEATAIGAAVSAGVRKIDIVAVGTVEGDAAYPCGNCRQMMQEFDVQRVIIEDPASGVLIYTLDDLLPHRFTQDDLVEHAEGP